MLIKPGTVVEVAERPEDQFKWQFLQVLDIFTETQSHNVILRGVRITRARNLCGKLPRMRNEVCSWYDINKEDNRPEHIQAAVEILVTEVIKIRGLTKTNAAFPTHRFNPNQWNGKDEAENKAVLVQRYKFYRYWPTLSTMTNKKSVSGALVRLRAADIEEKNFRVADDKLRNEFRGGIIRGGSFKGGRLAIPTVDLDRVKDDRNTPVTLGRKQMYTADDMFSGARGASCGIRQAGLQLRFACDFDEAACQTYQLNFPEAVLKQMDVFDFVESRTPTGPSDTVHISPPCQTWSPAHTCPGKNDEANAGALFACSGILRGRRPRLSTGEQTFGLLFDRNEEFFNALVGQYTALGYSFSWDILRFKDYGIPSSRRRLIWIASCPGEALPPFPMPTNAEFGRELPLPVTINSVLKTITRRHHDPLHDVEDMLSRARNNPKFPKTPYNDRCQIGTITTSGSEWAHPSGKRNFTARELACIQGFPLEHRFVGTKTQVRRQIGNAFPPVVVEIIYRHLRNWLLKQDLVVPRRRESLQRTSTTDWERRSQQDVIVLDPVDEGVVTSRHSTPRNLIIIDDDDIEQSYDQELSINRNRRSTRSQAKDVILIDESGDTSMSDFMGVEGSNFSRESSRTLSAESLLSLFEMEVD
ncbi:S-adenosyl-L-methionine-dependent methyltransferase [Xylaria sp. FL1042]|nr:S-adenosyl-L-methionine-dependent methyltransferase [Xylaria sp. FL1042]